MTTSESLSDLMGRMRDATQPEVEPILRVSMAVDDGIALVALGDDARVCVRAW